MIKMMTPFALLLLSLVLPVAHGFTVSTRMRLARTATGLFATSYEGMMELEKIKDAIVNKEYQLEEREDKDSEMTVVWLNRDGTVTLGDTDGPLYHSYSGQWWLVGDDQTGKPFRMRLDRSFDAGVVHTGDHEAGEFDYHVKREFWGSVERIGEIISIEGVMHGLDEASNIDGERDWGLLYAMGYRLLWGIGLVEPGAFGAGAFQYISFSFWILWELGCMYSPGCTGDSAVAAILDVDCYLEFGSVGGGDGSASALVRGFL